MHYWVCVSYFDCIWFPGFSDLQLLVTNNILDRWGSRFGPTFVVGMHTKNIINCFVYVMNYTNSRSNKRMTGKRGKRNDDDKRKGGGEGV